jgi:SAM-dependent methyltransferase
VNDREFRLLGEIEESHWWFAGKRQLLRSLLGDSRAGERVLDLGCGTGGILRDLLPHGRCYGMDRSELALRICRDRGFASLTRGDLLAIPFRSRSFDTVLLMDVIEHLDDDEGLLRRAAELLDAGGRIVVSVPAFRCLWSQHDVTFEHRRRYTARELTSVIRRAGLVPERVTYTNCAIFPVAAVWRNLARRTGLGRIAPRHDFWPVPRWLNALLAKVYAVEGWLLRRRNLPLGVSVACIARATTGPRGLPDPRRA